MSWNLHASGHAESKEDEAALINKLSDVVCEAAAGASGASISTQYHGEVDLLTGRDEGAGAA